MKTLNPEALHARALSLEALGANGLQELDVTISGDRAELRVRFFNDNELATVAADPIEPHLQFRIAGGRKAVAGPHDGQVRVVARSHTGAGEMTLEVAPVGDYSTYTLSVHAAHFDPVFSSLDFKFRPGCFRTDCSPVASTRPRSASPTIDYLAKDYASFRHQMFSHLGRNLPGWEPTSEADLAVTLVSVMAAAADQLSDFQDRVVHEGYLALARKRVSLARLARLMDYHIHEGNQASTWLCLEASVGVRNTTIHDRLVASTSPTGGEPFSSDGPFHLDERHNQIGLYSWSGSKPGLAAGSTSADLSFASAADADDFARHVRDGDVAHLVIAERLNPTTGLEPGRDLDKRQLLEVVGGHRQTDPITGAALVRVNWRSDDALTRDYAFTTHLPTGEQVDDVSGFCANVVRVFHGRLAETEFVEADAPLSSAAQRHYERTPWGTLCRLPHAPLAYRDSSGAPVVAPRSSLAVEVIGSTNVVYRERPSLIQSAGEPHFMVETDEDRVSYLRFAPAPASAADEARALPIPPGATVRCRYQIGHGPDGNVGADRIIHQHSPIRDITGLTNPFDVVDGRAPEPAAQIKRNAPHDHRRRQLRAITLADYVAQTERVAGVQRAAARYAWTGSWRTVQIAIDPVGREDLTRELIERVRAHLDAVHLIGEDIELRAARYVPIVLELDACVHADYWPAHVRAELERELSDEVLADGRLGLFHPDAWTFGQPLRRSQIIGRAQGVLGVDHVVEVRMKRFNDRGPSAAGGVLRLAPNEILRCNSDPDSMERGWIRIELRGGRR